MRTFKLTIEYDGSEFSGWQVQPDRRTVQGEIARALEETTGEGARITGAGRTDAGVHAVGQVASVRSSTGLGPEVLCRALNARLPFDIRVRSCVEAPPAFNARFEAKSRTYHYIFIRRQTALWRRYYYVVAGGLDTRAMRRSLAGLLGEKDFTTFSSAEDDITTKRCTMIRAELIESPPLVVLSLTADHFLNRMVRSIAGTVLEIGRGKPWSMEEIVTARDRSRAGPTLPPHALYLMGVTY
jgi:tRNA pseudouridine38-40 synthase